MTVSINITVAGGGGAGGTLQYANLAAFPLAGESEMLYLALDTKYTYAWTGAAYEVVGDGNSGGAALGPVILGAGPTNITQAAHTNRPVSSAQAGVTSVVFAATGTSGALDGDLVTILNTGVGIMYASGTVVASPGCRLFARENERLVFEYNAADAVYYGGAPNIVKAGVEPSFFSVPVAGATTISSSGTAAPSATDSSVATLRALAATSIGTHIPRLSYVGVAAINRNAGAGLGAGPLIWPTASIPSGFRVRMVVMAADALTACQSFYAVSATALGAGGEPSVKATFCGICADSTHTNLQAMSNDAAGSATPVDLGASFPANSNSLDPYDILFDVRSDGTAVVAKYEVTNLSSGAIARGTFTGPDFPAAGTSMGVFWARGSEANVTAVTLDWGGVFAGDRA